jgi:hypothetical protein
MIRRPRCNDGGSGQHFVKRGLSRRPDFESRADQRAFLIFFVREVWRGRHTVHAFCLRSTDYHFLLENPLGELSNAMRVIENPQLQHLRGA